MVLPLTFCRRGGSEANNTPLVSRATLLARSKTNFSEDGVGFTTISGLKMVAMFLFLVLSLVCVTSQSFGIGQPSIGKTDFESKDSRVLIFLPFLNEVKTNSADWDWLVTTLSESLEKYCRDRYKYKRISDEKWKRYKERNKLKKIDLYHPETAFKMAEQLGADGIILGRFKKRDNNSIIISGQIISIIHGHVIGESVETSTLDANLFKASEKMALDLGEKTYRMYWPTNVGAAERSAIFPGWGQFYKQRPVWGYVYSGSFIASAGSSALGSKKIGLQFSPPVRAATIMNGARATLTRNWGLQAKLTYKI